MLSPVKGGAGRGGVGPHVVEGQPVADLALNMLSQYIYPWMCVTPATDL